jgi:hypothetical protein
MEIVERRSQVENKIQLEVVRPDKQAVYKLRKEVRP